MPPRLAPPLRAALLVLLACAAPTAVRAPAAPAPAPDAGPAPVAATPEDPYLWLEDVTGERPLRWATGQSERTLAELGQDPGYAPLRKRLRAILESKERLPFVEELGGRLYNFWQDEAHPRGLWRRVASLAEYRKPSPAWETVLDLDALAAAEGEPWVWKRPVCLHPGEARCLLRLSRGGSDAVVVREFDLQRRAWVPGGFTLPEAKSWLHWRDLDTLFLGTDLGPGTRTTAGYPRQVRRWRRGTPPGEAPVVLEGQPDDLGVVGERVLDHGASVDLLTRYLTFFTSEVFLLEGGRLVRLDLPLTVARVELWDGQLVVELREPWAVGGATWPAGSLLATPLADFLAGGRRFTALFTPTPRSALAHLARLKTALVVVRQEDVKNLATVWTRPGGAWRSAPFEAPGGARTFEVEAVRSDRADEAWLSTTDFDLPSTWSHLRLGAPAERLKQQPAFFDARGLTVTQHFATSRDGTRIPYFQVARRDLPLDGTAPTLLTAYGGFEASLFARYDPLAGAAWLERGGVLVQANLRGGGEYGPAWHQAAVKEHRQRAFDDLFAVAEDLVARRVTSPARLGLHGASNGGLLAGVALTQRPELFGAVVCEVPLLDMKRYSQLLAGAAWMGEYGDPSRPEEWAFLSRYSPYQNVKAGPRYPRTLFLTSTRDDRVHPGHARKMVARMLEQGHDVLYFEDTEGGHAGDVNAEQASRLSALTFTFLARQLGLR